MMRRIIVAGLCLFAALSSNATGLFDIITKASTDRSVTVDIIDSTDGTPETGVVFNTSGIDLWYRREGAALVSITEATLAALTTAHADGGFLHVANGTYRLDLPDAAFATSANYVDFGGTVTGMIVIGGRVRLVDTNLEVTNIPANVTQYGGTNGTFASGRPEVNTTHAAGTAWNSGAIGANTLAADTLTAAKAAADLGTEFANATWALDATGQQTQGTFGQVLGDSAADADSVWSLANTNLNATVSSRASQTSVDTIDDFVDTEVAAILVDTAEIGTAGAGLTNINLPNQTMDIVGNITGNLSGSAGSVTGAVGSVTGAVGSVTAVSSGAISEASFATTAGSFDALGIVDQGTAQAATGTTLQLRSAAAFADDEIIGATCIVTGGSAGIGQARTISDYVSSTDTATVETWTTTPTGTITYQCFGTAASTGGGSAPTAAENAAAVWGLDATGQQTQGTFGQVLGDSAADTDSVWSLANTNLNATVSSRASQTTLDTLDDYVDTEVAAILVDTGTTLDGKIDTIDTVADAIKVKSDQLSFGVTNQLDVNVESMNANAVCGTGDSGTAWTGCP